MLRYIISSKNLNYIFTVEFETVVNVYSYEHRKLMYQLNTCFSTSEYRIALSNNEKYFVTCGWEKRKIELYNIEDGSLLWINKKINHIDSIKFSIDDKILYVQTEKYLYILDSSNGEIISKERGDIRIYLSDFDESQVIVVKENYEVYKGNELLYTKPLETFTSLDVTFSEECFYTAEVGSCLRCLNLTKDEEIWRYKPENEWHFIDIGYNSDLSCIYGRLIRYYRHDNEWLYIFDAKTGQILDAIEITNRTFLFDINAQNKVILIENRCYNLAEELSADKYEVLDFIKIY